MCIRDRISSPHVWSSFHAGRVDASLVDVENSVLLGCSGLIHAANVNAPPHGPAASAACIGWTNLIELIKTKPIFSAVTFILKNEMERGPAAILATDFRWVANPTTDGTCRCLKPVVERVGYLPTMADQGAPLARNFPAASCVSTFTWVGLPMAGFWNFQTTFLSGETSKIGNLLV